MELKSSVLARRQADPVMGASRQNATVGGKPRGVVDGIVLELVDLAVLAEAAVGEAGAQLDHVCGRLP